MSNKKKKYKELNKRDKIVLGIVLMVSSILLAFTASCVVNLISNINNPTILDGCSEFDCLTNSPVVNKIFMYLIILFLGLPSLFYFIISLTLLIKSIFNEKK